MEQNERIILLEERTKQQEIAIEKINEKIIKSFYDIDKNVDIISNKFNDINLQINTLNSEIKHFSHLPGSCEGAEAGNYVKGKLWITNTIMGIMCAAMISGVIRIILK